jgi:hypothetical protein
MDPTIPRAIAAGVLAFLVSLYDAAPSMTQAASARLLASIANTPAEYWPLHPAGQSITFCVALAVLSFATALRMGFADDIRGMWASVFRRRTKFAMPENEDEDNGVTDEIPYCMRGNFIPQEPTTPAQLKPKSLFDPSKNSIAFATNERTQFRTGRPEAPGYQTPYVHGNGRVTWHGRNRSAKSG